MKLTIPLTIIVLLVGATCLAQGAGSNVKLERMPESLESRYAVSALPPHLRDGATVYLLDPAKGYVARGPMA